MKLRNLRLAWRLLAREPVYSAVAVLGLAVALAACFLLFGRSPAPTASMSSRSAATSSRVRLGARAGRRRWRKGPQPLGWQAR
jgi:hypothetical protein